MTDQSIRDILAKRDRFAALCSAREVAALGVVDAARRAVAHLNFGEIVKAQNVLQGAILQHELADQAIAEFHRTYGLKKENSNGNAA